MFAEQTIKMRIGPFDLKDDHSTRLSPMLTQISPTKQKGNRRNTDAGFVKDRVERFCTNAACDPASESDVVLGQLPVRVERIWLDYSEVFWLVVTRRGCSNSFGHRRYGDRK